MSHYLFTYIVLNAPGWGWRASCSKTMLMCVFTPSKYLEGTEPLSSVMLQQMFLQTLQVFLGASFSCVQCPNHKLSSFRLHTRFLSTANSSCTITLSSLCSLHLYPLLLWFTFELSELYELAHTCHHFTRVGRTTKTWGARLCLRFNVAILMAFLHLHASCRFQIDESKGRKRSPPGLCPLFWH